MTPTPDGPGVPASRTSDPARRGWVRVGARAGAFGIIGLVALVVAMWLTPPVTVTVLGQEVQVGAVAPGTSHGWSGPGEADLFGEGPVRTVQQFEGPIRPRIEWRRFTRDAAASAFIQTSTTDGRRTVIVDTAAVGDALARGWMTFFIRLVLGAGLVGALLYLVASAAVAMVRGPRARVRSAPHRVWPLVLSALLAMGLTTAAAALTVVSARDKLAGVSNLVRPRGRHPARAPAQRDRAGPQRHPVAVIGDSTAAGVGNTPLTDPSDSDIACARSSDSYARVLQSATGWPVENLACASATISVGLLGPQPRRPVTPPPQVGVLKAINSLRVVIVSVGANDIGWSDFLQYCYGLPRCDDQASERLMQRRLDVFRLHYAQLLQQLNDLPTRPTVIVTGYYDPFGQLFDCPALEDPIAPLHPPRGYGFTPGPAAVPTRR